MKIIRLGNAPKVGRPAGRWPVFHLASDRTRFFRNGGEGTVTCGPVREAIGVFRDAPSLGAAVDDLPMSGFDGSDVSVPVGRAVGAAADHAAEWAYQPEAPSPADIGDDARTQAKAAMAAGLGYLGAMGAVDASVLVRRHGYGRGHGGRIFSTA